MKKQKILIIEDEAIIALNIQNMLETKGYEVCDIGKTADEAVRLTEKHNPDLILIDIILKGKKDGITAGEKIKEKCDTSIVYLTAHSDEKTLQRAKKTEPYGYILKPIGQEELLTTVEIALNKHEMEIKIKGREEEVKNKNKELDATNEELQASIEELEATIEELTASNEEFETANEELIVTQNDLEKSERQYRSLFNEILDGYALHEIIFDDSHKPVNYRFIDINPSFIKLTGLTRDIIGKTIIEVMPGIEKLWIETYEKVALTGKPEQFENYAKEIGKWFEVSVSRPSNNQFATIFKDISERKLKETILQKHSLKQNILLNVSKIVSSTLDLETILQTISDGAAELLNIETTAIYLLEEEELFLGATTPPLDSQMPATLRRLQSIDHPHIMKAISAQNPVILPDTMEAELSQAEQNIVNIRGLRSLIYCPFLQEEKAIGVLILGTTSQSRKFSLEEVDLCQTITNQLTLSIQNSRLHGGLIKYSNELENQINERRKAEKQIQSSLREKEILLKEIHHRVKNNMQIITSLLTLQAGQIEDEKIQEPFMTCENRIRSMALVHEQLYQSKDVASINFNVYINKLLKEIFIYFNINKDNIKPVINAKGISLGLDMAIPCGLIITELITNSLKHAFPKGKKGELRIEFKIDKKGNHSLTVNDNGVGIPENVDLKNTESFGFTLLKALVEQINGNIKITGKNGTKVTITFSGE